MGTTVHNIVVRRLGDTFSADLFLRTLIRLVDQDKCGRTHSRFRIALTRKARHGHDQNGHYHIRNDFTCTKHSGSFADGDNDIDFFSPK